MPTSHQPDPNVARLRREHDRDVEQLDKRARDAELIAAYVRTDLFDYLDRFRNSVFGFSEAPPRPPEEQS